MIILVKIILGFILGVCFGSLVKVLADRSLIKASFFGRSHCTECKKNLNWYDLIPVISYFVLKGRCRNCHTKLSPEYYLVEVTLGILIALVFFQSPLSIVSINNPWQLALDLYDLIFKTFVIVILSVVFLTDLKKTIIPDRITYPAIVLSIILITADTIYKIVWLYLSLKFSTWGRFLLPPYSDYFQRHVLIAMEPFLGSLIMGFAVGLFFLLLILATRGRGMGGGDLKLGIFLGLVFGFPQGLLVLLLSFFFGSIAGVILLLTKKRHFGQTIPFGPFLSLGGLVALFWGERLLDWYFKIKIGY